jgi:citrate lyase subunit beta/citryl-CoA lyase
MKPARSLLFVPAVDERRMEKALAMDADGVVFDLEDAVAVSEKPGARAAILRWKDAPRKGRLYVRINAVGTPFALRDLDTVAAAGVDGIVLPMAEDACDVRIADWALAQFERERELTAGAIEILPLVETARGLDAARDILSASPRVRRAAFGAGDWCANTGMVWTADNPGLMSARFALAVASRAADREPPIDTAFTDIRDQAAFTAEASRARDLGYQGKFCIHPAQVEHANRIFAPSDDEVARARTIWNGFVAGEAAGVAAMVIDDQFVDYPVAERARAVLVRAGEMPARTIERET